MDVLLGLAAPIAYGRRREFMEAVATAVAQAGVGSGVGVGLVHRVAREFQRSFVLEAQRETSLAAAPRHLRARQAAAEPQGPEVPRSRERAPAGRLDPAIGG